MLKHTKEYDIFLLSDIVVIEHKESKKMQYLDYKEYHKHICKYDNSIKEYIPLNEKVNDWFMNGGRL